MRFITRPASGSAMCRSRRISCSPKRAPSSAKLYRILDDRRARGCTLRLVNYAAPFQWRSRKGSECPVRPDDATAGTRADGQKDPGAAYRSHQLDKTLRRKGCRRQRQPQGCIPRQRHRQPRNGTKNIMDDGFDDSFLLAAQTPACHAARNPFAYFHSRAVVEEVRSLFRVAIDARSSGSFEYFVSGALHEIHGQRTDQAANCASQNAPPQIRFVTFVASAVAQ